MNITLGRIVHYKITADEAARITQSRHGGPYLAGWSKGAQQAMGNRVGAGEVYPMVIVRARDDGTVNGQVLLDGNDSLWVFSAKEGSAEGEWSWPLVIVTNVDPENKVVSLNSAGAEDPPPEPAATSPETPAETAETPADETEPEKEAA